MQAGQSRMMSLRRTRFSEFSPRRALAMLRPRFAYSLRPHLEKRRMHQPAGPRPRPGLDPDL